MGKVIQQAITQQKMLRSAIALCFEKGYRKPAAEIAKSAVLNMDFQTRVENIIQMENLEMQNNDIRAGRWQTRMQACFPRM